MGDVSNEQRLGGLGTLFLGVYNAVLSAVLVWILFLLFKSCPKPGDITGELPLNLWLYKFSLTVDQWLVVLVSVSGALGSYVHSCTSFVSYAGNRKLVKSWVWWYLLRVPIGVALALLFYFLARGGFLAANNANTLNPYGMAAIAGLAGMFSKNAIDKLREVFDTLFRTENGDERADKLNE